MEMSGVVREPSRNTTSWGAVAASSNSIHIMIALASDGVLSLCGTVRTWEVWWGLGQYLFSDGGVNPSMATPAKATRSVQINLSIAKDPSTAQHVG